MDKDAVEQLVCPANVIKQIRPGISRIKEMTQRISYENSCKELKDLIDKIDALNAELQIAKQRTERGDVWNAWSSACKQLDETRAENQKLRARIEKLRIALGQIIPMTDCPHMSNYAKDVFEKHCRNAIAQDDREAK